MPRTQGQWLWLRNSDLPKKAMIAAPASGRQGISQSSCGMLDMAALLTLPGLAAGRRQMGQRHLRRRRRQRLLVEGRLLVRLAQVLPDADVESAAAPVQHQDQCQ